MKKITKKTNQGFQIKRVIKKNSNKANSQMQIRINNLKLRKITKMNFQEKKNLKKL